MKFKMLLTALVLALSVSAHAGFMAVANVSKIHGTVFVNKEKVKEGQEIAEGMMIAIPKKGDYIDVKFQNGHVVRFLGASVMVKELNPKNTLLELLKGKIYSAIKPLTKDETFQVKTRRASFAVRGTHFFVEESKKDSYLCVCEGVVNTKSSKGEVDVKKDEDLRLAKAKDELKATVAAQSMVDSAKAVFTDMGAQVQ
jgi:ferric-dicitrate binding protein FerR (iron transport regulator)